MRGVWEGAGHVSPLRLPPAAPTTSGSNRSTARLLFLLLLYLPLLHISTSKYQSVSRASFLVSIQGLRSSTYLFPMVFSQSAEGRCGLELGSAPPSAAGYWRWHPFLCCSDVLQQQHKRCKEQLCYLWQPVSPIFCFIIPMHCLHLQVCIWKHPP